MSHPTNQPPAGPPYQPSPGFPPYESLMKNVGIGSGRPPKKSKRPWLIVSIIVLGFLFLTSCVGLLASSVDDAGTQPVSSAEATPTCFKYSQPYCETPTAESSETASAKPKVTKAPEPKLSRAQEQAIGQAEDYLDYSHFSRKGLIGQLKYEGHSTKNATFAVDYLHVNWNKQAAGAAEDYLDYSHFSRSGLIDQLEYEGYTHSQAVYGVKKAGL